jgi:hypothetical protein
VCGPDFLVGREDNVPGEAGVRELAEREKRGGRGTYNPLVSWERPHVAREHVERSRYLPFGTFFLV